MEDVIWANVFCFGPVFILSIIYGWFSMEEEIKPLEEQQRRKKEGMAHNVYAIIKELVWLITIPTFIMS